MTRTEQIAAASGRSPLDVLEFWLERAAIRQYDAGMTRPAAEAAAYEDCVTHFAPSRPSLATLPRSASDSAPAGESACAETGEANESRTGQMVNAGRVL